jgi:hypothetical protein
MLLLAAALWIRRRPPPLLLVINLSRLRVHSGGDLLDHQTGNRVRHDLFGAGSGRQRAA